MSVTTFQSSARAERRRHERSTFNQPTAGAFRFFGDVILEQYSDDELSVLSGMAAKRDEELRMDQVSLGPPLPVRVRVLESRPTIVGGRLLHRLRLAVVGDQHTIDARTIVGCVARELSIRVLDISPFGCLFQCNTAIEAGSVGDLHLLEAGHASSGRFRVSRCRQVPGQAADFRVGGEFVAPRAAGDNDRANGPVAAIDPRRVPFTREEGNDMKSLITRFVREEEGQDLIEYALLAGFISLACVAAITTLGTSLNTVYTNIQQRVAAAPAGTGGTGGAGGGGGAGS